MKTKLDQLEVGQEEEKSGPKDLGNKMDRKPNRVDNKVPLGEIIDWALG